MDAYHADPLLDQHPSTRRVHHRHKGCGRRYMRSISVASWAGSSQTCAPLVKLRSPTLVRHCRLCYNPSRERCHGSLPLERLLIWPMGVRNHVHGLNASSSMVITPSTRRQRRAGLSCMRHIVHLHSYDVIRRQQVSMIRDTILAYQLGGEQTYEHSR